MLCSLDCYLPTFRDNSSFPSSSVQESKGFIGSFTVEDVYDVFFPPETSVTNYPSTLRNITVEKRDLEITSVYSGKQTRNKQILFVQQARKNVMIKQEVRDGTNELSNVKVSDGGGGG